jgi:outer membrane protein OmpA-like peptidoglycan-associated protein
MKTASRLIFIVSAFFILSFIFGCAGLEFAPKKAVWYYPKELPSADRALKEAKAEGKSEQCPVEFKEVKEKVELAYDTYIACKTKEAIEIAKDAEKKAKALCPKKPKVLDKMTLRINFDFDKYNIRESDKVELQKAIDFIKKYPGAKVMLEGHTDSIGSEKYNLTLSKKRAKSTKDYLVAVGGLNEKLIQTKGYGEKKPIASNKTKDGRAQNRRVEILILSN